MRVLFLIGSYYPYYSANGLCVKNVIDECVSRGIEVTCIADAVDGYKDESVIDGAKVVRVKPRLILRWQQYVSTINNTKTVMRIDSIFRLLNRAKMFLMSSRWPQVSPLYTRRYSDAAIRLHEIERFDVVVSAYTPIDCLLAGYDLKRQYPEIAFIPYYLDAFAGGWGPSRWSQEKIEQRTRRYEEIIDERADAIVSMNSSRPYHENNPLSPIIQTKRIYLDVPMMTDPKQERVRQRQAARPYVLYAGCIPFPKRDPRPVLDLMVEVCNRLDIDFILVGECSVPSLFDSYIKKSEGRIKYLGWQDKASIEKLEVSASAFVNIGSENPNTIPCKIFEYMAHLKPIISTFRIEDEPSISYLKEYGHVWIMDERLSMSSHVIDDACSFLQRYERFEIPSDACSRKFQKSRPGAFVDVIEGFGNVDRIDN